MEQKKRIAIFLQDMYQQGGQFVTSVVAQELAKKGFLVDLLVSSVEKDIQKRKPTLKPYQVPDAIHKIILPYAKARQNVLAINRYIRQSKPDILMPVIGHYLIAVMLSRLLTRIRTPVVYVEHMFCGFGCAQASCSCQTWFRRALFGWCLRRTMRIIAVSEGVKRALQSAFDIENERIVVAYNPVVVRDSEVDCGVLHEWLLEKAPNRIPVIVAAGALHPGKGFDVLIKAVKQVSDVVTCRLIIFGEGKERSALERIVKERGLENSVSLPGHTPVLMRQFSRADCFVLSSVKETFSIVLVEALMCGIPVVAADCPVAPREILRDGQFGMLVPCGDADAMADAIRKTLLGQGVRPPAESWAPYTVDKVMERYYSVLEAGDT